MKELETTDLANIADLLFEIGHSPIYIDIDPKIDWVTQPFFKNLTR